MNIFQPQENTENMGDRALQAAQRGITPVKFDNFREYTSALRNFDLDKTKTTATPLEQKLAAGMSVAAQGLEEKFNEPTGSMGSLFTLISVNPNYFNAERMTQYLQTNKDIGNVLDYFLGKLGASEALDTENDLVKTELANMPAVDDQYIREKIYAAAQIAQQYARGF